MMMAQGMFIADRFSYRIRKHYHCSHILEHIATSVGKSVDTGWPNAFKEQTTIQQKHKWEIRFHYKHGLRIKKQLKE